MEFKILYLLPSGKLFSSISREHFDLIVEIQFLFVLNANILHHRDELATAASDAVLDMFDPSFIGK